MAMSAMEVVQEKIGDALADLNILTERYRKGRLTTEQFKVYLADLRERREVLRLELDRVKAYKARKARRMAHRPTIAVAPNNPVAEQWGGLFEVGERFGDHA